MNRITHLFWSFFFALLVAVPVFAQTPPSSPPEVRGFWADAFNPGIKSEAEIDLLIDRLHRAHCNAIFAQVRKRGDAYYWSTYEPRATDIPTTFDPLGTLIRKAHAARPRISVHAWINTCAVGGVFAPGHILGRHPEYRSLSDKGETYDNEAVKIDPGVPGAADWTARVYLDVARHYDVDGIHFDFVRYGGAKWGYAPESVARFNRSERRTHSPDASDPAWQQWRRDQVTAMVRRVYANVQGIKPGLIVSAALIPWGDAPKSEADWANSAPYSQVFQDWRAWMQEGILDLGCPMTYFRSDKHKSYQENWAEWIRSHQYHRAATIAVGTWFNTIDESLDLARLSRAANPATGNRAAGLMFYSYEGTDAMLTADSKRKELLYDEKLYDALPALFESDAPFPDFAWKAHPTNGLVRGTVLSSEHLQAADGATILLKQQDAKRSLWAAMNTDGNGFFAFVEVPPGKYTVTVQHDGETSNPVPVEVTAGGCETADFLMNAGDLPDPSAVAGSGAKLDGSVVLFKAAQVAVGSAVLGDRCFITDPGGRQPLEIRLPALPMPLIPGDLVTLTGTIHHAGGRAFAVADSVRWVGCNL